MDGQGYLTCDLTCYWPVLRELSLFMGGGIGAIRGVRVYSRIIPLTIGAYSADDRAENIADQGIRPMN